MFQLMTPTAWSNEPLAEASSDYHKLDDCVLVERSLHGDERAWAALLGRYGNLIYSISVKSNLSPEDVAEVFQSVCLRLLESLEQLQDEPTLSSWLTSITLRRCRQLMASEPVEEELADLLDEAPLSDEAIEQIVRAQMLQQALWMIEEPSRRRLTHLLYETESWPKEAIAPESEMLDPSPEPDLGYSLKTFMRVLNKLDFRSQRRIFSQTGGPYLPGQRYNNAPGDRPVTDAY